MCGGERHPLHHIPMLILTNTLHSTHLTPSPKKRYCWHQRLKECSVSSLKKYLRIIYTVQWLIIHLYIHHTSVVKHLKQYKLTFFFFFKLTLHIGTCKAALVSTPESTEQHQSSVRDRPASAKVPQRQFQESALLHLKSAHELKSEGKKNKTVNLKSSTKQSSHHASDCRLLQKKIKVTEKKCEGLN